FRPAIGNALMISQKAVFLAGEETVYRGDICSLGPAIRVFGRRQHFLGIGLWAEDVTIKGTANAFTRCVTPTVRTQLPGNF
ncbi:MAG: hypothetical protein PHC30_09710, partial [Lentisphaeria bacterium]|nr:hypothetical protein [Lentisphaeria bacterium]